MFPVVVRGGGDLATGTILHLSCAGYPVIVLESSLPTAIRREAAFSEAVYKNIKTIEGISCVKAGTAEEALSEAKPGRPVMLVDENASSLKTLKPEVLVDAIMAKRNCGTKCGMAPLVIALGPGFKAGRDADFVIETKRGHRLGRIISDGCAAPNTGIPGMIEGHGADRVIHAPEGGCLSVLCGIGSVVRKGDLVAEVVSADGKKVPVYASLSGVIRGMLPDGFGVTAGLKMADIDPRLSELENCRTVSDKARCIAGSVLTLISAYEHHCLDLLRNAEERRE